MVRCTWVQDWCIARCTGLSDASISNAPLTPFCNASDGDDDDDDSDDDDDNSDNDDGDYKMTITMIMTS